jgi:hypothetical protein
MVDKKTISHIVCLSRQVYKHFELTALTKSFHLAETGSASPNYSLKNGLSLTKPVIEIKNVSKPFGGTQALDDVSLTLLPR